MALGLLVVWQRYSLCYVKFSTKIFEFLWNKILAWRYYFCGSLYSANMTLRHLIRFLQLEKTTYHLHWPLIIPMMRRQLLLPICAHHLGPPHNRSQLVMSVKAQPEFNVISTTYITVSYTTLMIQFHMVQDMFCSNTMSKKACVHDSQVAQNGLYF